VRRLAVLAAALLAVAGCSTSTPSSTPVPSSSPVPTTTASASSTSGLPAPAHVLVVVFENKDEQSVIGSAQAPYLTALAQQGAAFSDAHGVTHPSEPNYLALFSGSTQGITDDSCPHTFSGPNLGRQLIDGGRTFTGYSEDLPAAGYRGCSAGDYARKHNPWVNFGNLPASVNQPYSALPADLGQLPTVAFVVPNLCDDMHDCPVKTGDDWARAHLAAYVSWARDHDSLLIVTFDEDENTAANRIATFLVGPMVRPGTSDQRIDHYSVLRTIEEMYGLPPLGEAANREPITGIWTAG
jgi:acid phosphatase